MYLRFMPKLALTAWDIVTWQVTFGVIIKPLRAEHTDVDRDLQQFVESTITVAY